MGERTNFFHNEISNAESWEDMDRIEKKIPPKNLQQLFQDLLEKEEARQQQEENEKAIFRGRKPEKITLSFSKIQELVNLKRATFYNVINGAVPPKRDHLLKIGYALHASANDMNELLKMAGHKELYFANAEDRIIMFGLNHKTDVYELDEKLKEKGCSLRLSEEENENE